MSKTVEEKAKEVSATKVFCSEVNGDAVYQVNLRAGGISVAVTNIGCSILAIETPDKFGEIKNIVAGYTKPEAYLDNPDYLGCVLGRYANRIAGGRFEFAGSPVQLSLNDGKHHLHGGVSGFQQKIWKVSAVSQTAAEAGVLFEYISKDGEEGYPGNAAVQVRYTLKVNKQLEIKYVCQSDKATPVNLSNHSYFNLTGFEEEQVYGHLLQLFASRYTPNDEDTLPTGAIEPVLDTPFDFVLPRKIGLYIGDLKAERGYNHNFVLDTKGLNEIMLAAVLSEPSTGREVRVYTDQPGLQVYTANWWRGNVIGRQGKIYREHGAVALETQAFPDSPNHRHFPNTIVLPGQIYQATTIYAFGVLS